MLPTEPYPCEENFGTGGTITDKAFCWSQCSGIRNGSLIWSVSDVKMEFKKNKTTENPEEPKMMQTSIRVDSSRALKNNKWIKVVLFSISHQSCGDSHRLCLEIGALKIQSADQDVLISFYDVLVNVIKYYRPAAFMCLMEFPLWWRRNVHVYHLINLLGCAEVSVSPSRGSSLRCSRGKSLPASR